MSACKGVEKEMKLTIDETKMTEEAINWFWAMSPGPRGTLLQAVWECQGRPGAKEEPEPEANAEEAQP